MAADLPYHAFFVPDHVFVFQDPSQTKVMIWKKSTTLCLFDHLERQGYIWAYFLFGIPWDFMVPNVVASQNLMCVETLNLLQVVGQK